MNFFQYMDVATFVIILFAILSVIVLINNAIKALKEMTKPVTDLREEIDKINEHLERVDEKLDGDYKAMEHERELNKLLLRSVRQLIIHETDGDHEEAGTLKVLRKDIDEYLIKNA